MGDRARGTGQRLSVVVPLYDEADSIEPLVESVHQALAGYPQPWELVLVDDGSTDATASRLVGAIERFGNHVRAISLQRNFGQTAALQAGIDAARGEVIATLDGDLQNDPADIPHMVHRLLAEDLDLVAGWRRDRRDGLVRRLPSRLANGLIGRITGIALHDYGCTLKVFRAAVLKRIRLYGEMHRFIPAWVAAQTSPSRIQEEVVRHHRRRFGASKYGLGRTFRVLLDLLAVYFFIRYRARPGHFFGKIGLFFGALGGLALGWLLIVKYGMGEDIGDRPLLLVGILFVMLSVQLLTTGVLAEMMTRTYYESSDTRSYVVRDQMPADADAGWRQPS